MKIVDQSYRLAEFERIMLPHLDSAYNLARWLTRNEHDAEDLVQEAYLRACRFFHGFHPEDGDGKAWLLAIVRNTCFTWMRQRKRMPMETVEEEFSSGPTATAAPDHVLSEKERGEALAGCIEALPGEYREVIVLRELEEMSYQEIADTAGLAIGTVMSRLSRARKRLKDCLTGKLAGAGVAA